jgi:hypothetical protein
LVEAPAAWLSRWSRRQVVLIGALFGITAILVLILQHDALVIAGFSLPEATAALTSIEITAYLDVMITVATAASVLRAGMAIRWVRARLSRRPARRRDVRTRRRLRLPASDNDDEGPALLVA